MKKTNKNKRKCGMYYNVYIPWCFKNNKINQLDEEDITWYKEEYLNLKK